MRRLCATVLVMEAVVIGLAIPVAISVERLDAAVAGVAGTVLVLACLLYVGLLRYRWAYWAGMLLQVLVVATGTVVATMYFLGVIFGVLWVVAIWLGRRAEPVDTR